MTISSPPPAALLGPLSLLGRALLVGIFLLAAGKKVTDFEGHQAYMAAFGMPATAFFLVAAIAFSLAGGFAVLLGFHARVGALLFPVPASPVPATLVFHRDLGNEADAVHLLKNLSIAGGLFHVMALGPGPWSIDARRRVGGAGVATQPAAVPAA